MGTNDMEANYILKTNMIKIILHLNDFSFIINTNFTLKINIEGSER